MSTADGYKPGMAESWDVSDDGLTYTFHLRQDAKWSDGDPVTAHDFEYAWRRICDPSFASEALQAMTDYVQGAQEYFDGTGSYDDVKATAIDDYTFEVVLKNVTPFFPQLVANDVYLPYQAGRSGSSGGGLGEEAGNLRQQRAVHAGGVPGGVPICCLKRIPTTMTQTQ